MYIDPFWAGFLLGGIFGVVITITGFALLAASFKSNEKSS